MKVMNIKSNMRSQFPTSSIILTRQISTCSLQQLSADIEMIYIYNELIDIDSGYNLSRKQLADIQQKIVSGFYPLSPLQVKILELIDFHQFIIKEDYPDYYLQDLKDGSHMLVHPEKEDVLVLMGLSIMLYRLFTGREPKEGYRISNHCDQFNGSLSKMHLEKMERVYRLDLHNSMGVIPTSKILSKIRYYVDEKTPIYNLIESFLSLPICDYKEGYIFYPGKGIPPVGELTNVIFNEVLYEVFDHEFSIRFPQIVFTRYINLVCIFCRDNVIEDSQLGFLLDELGLRGEWVSIGPGGERRASYNVGYNVGAGERSEGRVYYNVGEAIKAGSEGWDRSFGEHIGEAESEHAISESEQAGYLLQAISESEQARYLLQAQAESEQASGKGLLLGDYVVNLNKESQVVVSVAFPDQNEYR